LPAFIVCIAFKLAETYAGTCHQDWLFIALYASGIMPLRPGALPIFSLLMAALTSSKVMGTGKVEIKERSALGDVGEYG
jgi:hypothetical protein